MKILIILGHPNRDSFNGAIAETAKDALAEAGHIPILHNIHEEGFDPVITVKELDKNAQLEETTERHCRELAEADGIIIVHPNWWGQPPAILKGWIDRVIRPGVAYEFLEGDSGEGVPRGLLKARQAVVFNTGDTPPERELGVFGDPLENIWKKCIFEFCGVTNFYRRTFSVVVTSTPEERRDWLREVTETVKKLFPG